MTGSSVARQSARYVELVELEGDGQQLERHEPYDREPADRPLSSQHGHAGEDEQQTRESRGVEDAAAARAVERRPGRDAQQHRQQHQAEGVHRRADDERVGAGPQHLDAEGRGARGEREHEAQRRARRPVARRRFARGGRLARGRRGPGLARKAQRHAADEQARRRRHHQCRLHAERRHQHEGRECHSDGAAQRVQQIETPEAGVHLPPRAREELDGERHCRPQQDRRRQQDEGGERSDARLFGRAREACRRHERPVGPRQPPQQGQRHEGGHPDRELEPRVGPQRIRDRAARDERAADRQAAHEDSQHHRHRGRGAAEDQAERAQPERLVDERRGARERDEVGQRARDAVVGPRGWRERPSRRFEI